MFSNVGQTESLRTAITGRPELCSMGFIGTIPNLSINTCLDKCVCGHCYLPI